MNARWEFRLLRLWHAALAGGFLVAYVTADEDTYAMHVFAGYWVVAAIALRLGLAALGSSSGPLALPRPRLAWARPGRNPLFAWMAAILIVGMAVAGVTGVAADFIPPLEDLHEGLAEASLWLVLAHAAIIAWIFQGRRVREMLKGATPALLAIALLAAPAAFAADAARDAIKAGYAKQAGAGFGGFSAERGRTLFESKNTASPDYASCTTCHTADPTAQGRHAKTGRAIQPVAVSANPKRFTDAAKVEERFERDCQTVLGRVCTATEKGDYIAYMESK
ncbi:conserved membrane protein of unknown function(Cytochrome c domain,167-278) [Magnetospirillum sp. XM-1]|uniref:DUF1924 domain-containing protein n=1 Tax=Magnetospirillum sp. XM-1 TaxID=1663591 RepID=UPI00073E0493|nr:DUF1924 domain-containing protein [Magnetospirillum sp. XM-1]CUW38244.1 conserved membrane protein of unknown function(Cytochrome c domain,167-278) [Magnetospirillum sp. XM-1]